MADPHTSGTRSYNMSRIRGRDTKPELVVRRMLHAAGFRFRLHRRDLPGTPDIVLRRHRAVVFVNGCFWHWHGCPLCRLPATRTEFWQTKLLRNVERDAGNIAALRQNWRVCTVWECAVRGRVSPKENILEAQLLTFLISDSESMELSGSWRPEELKGTSSLME